MFFYILLITLMVDVSIAATTYNASSEANIKFYGFNSQSLSTSPFVSTLDTPISQQCNPNGNFTIIVHSWLEGYQTPWVQSLIKNFLYYRGGCVFFMDYSYYSNVSDYFALVNNYRKIYPILTAKMKQIGNYDRQLCFGHSVGSRMCVDAGLAIGNKTAIDRMELCDPAGPGFNIVTDPKPAAKNVACINTSNDKGTSVYNCHQNFRMGFCGNSQAAAASPPLGSHGLCPYFYTLSFTNNFVPNNFSKCSSTRMAKNLTDGVKMGYTAVFNRTLVRGDIFIATAKYVPYVVVNGVINNAMTPLTQYINSGPANGIQFNNTNIKV